MPSLQPRWPSIGLASRSFSTLAMIASRRACSSGLIPSASSRLRVSMSSLYSLWFGRNSCSGGSSSRTVTGSPSIARKIPTKSSRWNGRSFSSAMRRVAWSAAMIISRTIGIRAGALGVERGIGVGPHAEPFRPVAIRPGQELADLVAELAFDGLDGVEKDLAGPAVDGDPVALTDDATAHFEDATVLVHGDFRGADHAGLAHPDRDHRRVRGPAAPRGDDALRGVHARHVFRRGLGTNEV